MDNNQHLFRLQLPEAALEVSIDQTMMMQIISNLVSNAIKYSRVGTEVEFELKEVGGQVMIQIAAQRIGESRERPGKYF